MQTVPVVTRALVVVLPVPVQYLVTCYHHLNTYDHILDLASQMQISRSNVDQVNRTEVSEPQKVTQFYSALQVIKRLKVIVFRSFDDKRTKHIFHTFITGRVLSFHQHAVRWQRVCRKMYSPPEHTLPRSRSSLEGLVDGAALSDVT